MIFCGPEGGFMSASNLALTTLFLATMFAETEWREFTLFGGELQSGIPRGSSKTKGTSGTDTKFSAAARAESYELTYADHSPSTDWKAVVNGERDSIGERLWRICGRRETYLSRRLSGKWDPFAGQDTTAELAIYFVGSRLYVLHAFAQRGRLGRRISLHF